MAKLHEILAVEPDKEGIAKRIVEESLQVFKSKHHVFVGMTKELKMDTSDEGNDSLEKASREYQAVTTTVDERLDYTQQVLTDWLDVVLTKEVANQTVATADLVVGGQTLASDVPATFLLGLETKLKRVRELYDSVPTLAPSLVWEKDVNAADGIYRSKHDEVRAKTQKRPMHRILVEPTQHHRAEIEKWNEEVVVGKYTTSYQSGMLPAAEKARMLSRVDNLIQSVKQARMRANTCEVAPQNIGEALFNYIHG